MQFDRARIFNDPNLFFLSFEGESACFVQMDRESCARSIFFDHRIERAGPEVIRVPLDPLLDEFDADSFTPPRIRFIHHFAQSGSTLLARALDRPDNLVIREPLHLRQLGVFAGASSRSILSQDLGIGLNFSLAMLGKRFTHGSSVIVKGNVPISLLSEAIAEADPDQPAILLYFPLEDYCAAVLRTPNHQRWLLSVIDEIGLGNDPLVGDVSKAELPEKAAALWFAMVKRYERLLARYPAMHSLDSNNLFERPAETIAAASQLLDAGISATEAAAVANGPLFSTHSKNPAVPFDAKLRVERATATKAALKPEIAIARRWVDRQVASHGLPPALERPLVGDSTGLV